MKKSLSQYAKYGKSEYAKTLYKWGKRNPNKIKKIIDDLYKKSFPNGQEDVIKFQSRYIDELSDIVFGNFESTLTSYPKSRKRMGSGRVFAFSNFI